jgi:hypothetical protein
MGLDIQAASHLRYVGPIPDYDELGRLEEQINAEGKCLDDVYFRLRPNDEGWESRLGGLEPGLYEVTPATRQHAFRVGSYGGYNEWREQLSQYALGVTPEAVWVSPDEYAGRPFVELINFTDCDGRIAGRVAAKLAADFRAHAAGFERFVAGAADADGCLRVYREFATAFGLAEQQGALRFC